MGNESEITNYISKNIYNNRLFAIGIDTSVNTAFIRAMAKVGNGKAEFIYPDEDIEVVYSYAYFDVEGDGIKELIVKKSYKVLFSGTMHDEWQIYTLMEGTVTQLCIPKEKYSPSAIFFFGNGEIATTYYDGMEDLDCYYYSEKPDRSFSELEAYTHEFILEEGEMHLHFNYNNKDYYGELDREKYYADMNDLIIQNEKNVQFEEFN